MPDPPPGPATPAPPPPDPAPPCPECGCPDAFLYRDPDGTAEVVCPECLDHTPAFRPPPPGDPR